VTHPLAARITAAGVRNRRQSPEEALQRQCTDFMRSCVPLPPDGPAWSSVNPIPSKTKAAAGISKAMGLRAGVDDWFLLWRGTYIGIEFKAKRGSESDAQKLWAADLAALGFRRYVVRSLDELVAALKAEEVPVRAKVW
jgi:hypothetical protein